MLKEKAGQLVSNHPEFEKEFKLYCSVERLTPGVFAEVKNNHKVMCANVDMYSGSNTATCEEWVEKLTVSKFQFV